MDNINGKMKKAKIVLFSDFEQFNSDVTGMTLDQIKDRFQIIGRVRKLQQYDNKFVYGFGMSCTSYNFTLTLVN